MMLKAIITMLSTMAVIMPVQARVIAFSLKDEIAGTQQYHVQIQADRYEEYTWEEGLNWVCFPSGEVIVSWKQGGQYSGYVVDPRGEGEMNYKLDDQEPGTFKFNELNREPRPKLKDLYDGMLKAKRLVLRRGPDAGVSTGFKLAGFKSHAGPNSPFGKQCAAELSSDP